MGGALPLLFQARLVESEANRRHHKPPPHATPSFFCSEEEEVVYWNISFLPG